MQARILLVIVVLGFAVRPVYAAEAVAVAEARLVMQEFMQAFNARDEARWADTLLFPHIRIASGSVIVHQNKAAFVAASDLEQFAQLNDWSHSRWDSIEVMQADDEKVHFQVTFTRFNTDGEPYVTYNSLYVLQKVDGRWGIRARSSFAP